MQREEQPASDNEPDATRTRTFPVTARPAAPVRRRTSRHQFVPPQHGAWAMLFVPYLVGVILAGWRWLHLPLLGAWVAGYLLSYYVLQAIKSRRPRRFRPQMLLYAPVTAVLGGIVVVARPQVLVYAPAYALLLLVNAGYAWRRRERALVNDFASVAQSCLMVLVAATVAGVAVADVAPAFAAVLLYFAGTVFYVKTMIRERGRVGYRRASVAYHALAIVPATWLSVPLGVLFLLLLLRAWALPGRQLRPVQVGLLEIVASVLLLVVVVATLGRT